MYYRGGSISLLRYQHVMYHMERRLLVLMMQRGPAMLMITVKNFQLPVMTFSEGYNHTFS